MKSKHTYEQVQVKRELKFSNCMQLQVKISQSTSNLILHVYIQISSSHLYTKNVAAANFRFCAGNN